MTTFYRVSKLPIGLTLVLSDMVEVEVDSASRHRHDRIVKSRIGDDDLKTEMVLNYLNAISPLRDIGTIQVPSNKILRVITP